MEEFNFESELFESEKPEPLLNKEKPQFRPLYFFPKDYESIEDLDEKFKSDPKLLKQYADYLYFKGEYVAALGVYKELESLYRGNSFMTKCVQESVAWCLAKLGRCDEAETLVQGLQPDANTYESKHGLEFFLSKIKHC